MNSTIGGMTSVSAKTVLTMTKKQGALKPPVKPHGKHRDDCNSSSLFFVSIHSPKADSIL